MKQNDVYGGFGYKPMKDSPGMAAVKKAAVELAVEKMIGVSNLQSGHHKKDSKNTMKSR